VTCDPHLLLLLCIGQVHQPLQLLLGFCTDLNTPAARRRQTARCRNRRWLLLRWLGAKQLGKLLLGGSADLYPPPTCGGQPTACRDLTLLLLLLLGICISHKLGKLRCGSSTDAYAPPTGCR
jgi:hypothetical protein